MGAAALGFMIGGTIVCFLLTSLYMWVFKKFGVVSDRRFFYAPFCALVTATILGGFGLADGGSPEFQMAFMQYLVPAAIAAVIVFAINNKPEPVDMTKDETDSE